MSPVRTAIDEAAHADWVGRILAAATPADMLLRALETLDAGQDIATQAAVFESVLWRADTRHYWVYFRMTHVYAELGRPDAGFVTACLAVQMHPDRIESEQPFRHMFQELARRGEAKAALDVFHAHLRYFPERPIAPRYQVDALATDLAAPPAPRAPGAGAHRRNHRVVEEEERPATPVRGLAGAVPVGLRPLAAPMRRDAIDVAELADAELLLCNDAAVVRDAGGLLHPDLSVADYPELIAGRILDPPAGSAPVGAYEAEEAVLLLDAFPPPNLAHFLMDQVARLELYRRAGADLAGALVVGPALRTAYQRGIMARAGGLRMLSTNRLARVRVRRLWVSSECRALQHPGHYASGWAIAHARALLGGRGTTGTRRLYLSRADATTRQLANEAAVQDALTRHGFETIVPGAMPYEAQLAAFREASHIVAVHGAALAHLVLCPPGARVLELFHPLYGTWAYAMLASGCGIEYAAHAGRDGLSDAAELNDPDRADPGRGRFGERNLRVAPEIIDQFVAGAA